MNKEESSLHDLKDVDVSELMDVIGDMEKQSQYIMLQNDGEILSDAFKYIGASTKVDNPDTIGEFGSGANYAIAWLMRNNIDFRIFTGTNEIVFSKRSIDFRGKLFQAIEVNGDNTSITTDMGKDWTAWYAIREFWCNSLDEGSSFKMLVNNNEVVGLDGTTRVFIVLDGHTSDIWKNWNMYFCNDRKDFVQKHVPPNSYGMDVLIGKSEPVIYRKGIRVTPADFKTGFISAFHYNLQYCRINEYREIANAYVTEDQITRWWCSDAQLDAVSELIEFFQQNKQKITKIYEFSLNWSYQTLRNIDVWKEALKDKQIVEYEMGGSFTDLFTSSTVYLPAGLCELLLSANAAEHVSGKEYRTRGNVLNPNKKQQATIKLAQDFLKEAEYEILFPIVYIEYKDRHLTGNVDLKTKEITVSDRALNSIHTLVCTLIECNELLKTGYDEDTHDWRKHLVECYVNEMCTRTGHIL